MSEIFDVRGSLGLCRLHTGVRDETETSSVWTDARRLRDVWCVKCTFEKVKISS